MSGLPGALEGSLTEPFRNEVWLITVVLAVLMFLFLKFSADKSNVFRSWSLSSLSTLAAFCQQGILIDVITRCN